MFIFHSDCSLFLCCKKGILFCDEMRVLFEDLTMIKAHLDHLRKHSTVGAIQMYQKIYLLLELIHYC